MKNEPLAIIGIDPGYKGAVASLEVSGGGVSVEGIYSCPVTTILKRVARMDSKTGKKKSRKQRQTVYQKAKMIRMLYDIQSSKDGRAFAILERAQAMQDQGVVSTFANGMGYGYWEMALIALMIPYISIHPMGWARNALAQAPESLEGKDRTIWLASERFPGVNLVPPRHRVPADGWADAVNIAYYGYERKVWEMPFDEFTWHPGQDSDWGSVV